MASVEAYWEQSGIAWLFAGRQMEKKMGTVWLNGREQTLFVRQFRKEGRSLPRFTREPQAQEVTSADGTWHGIGPGDYGV